MPIRYDISLDNNELVIHNGDFLIVESDTQHIVDTMNAFAGWWKEYPLDGVGIMGYTKSPVDVQKLNRKMQIEIESDGYKVKAPAVTLSSSGELNINPNAELL
jgi:hypothetical protein